jgi:hypothetical protein
MPFDASKHFSSLVTLLCFDLLQGEPIITEMIYKEKAGEE